MLKGLGTFTQEVTKRRRA